MPCIWRAGSKGESVVLPRLTAEASYTRHDGAIGFEGLGSGTTSSFENFFGQGIDTGLRDRYAFGVSALQPVYRGGAAAAAVRLARWSSMLTDEEARAVIQETVYELCRAYHDLVLTRHLLEVNRKAVESARAHAQRVAEEDLDIRPGYEVDVEFYTEELEDRMVLPRLSVFRENGETAVMVVEEGRARSRRIKTGFSTDREIVVDDGLKAGDRVILNPRQDNLRENIRVRYWNDNPGKQAGKQVRSSR